MKIEFLQDVKHAGRTHRAGDQITVDKGEGRYFLNCGWATRLDGETPPPQPPPQNVELDVHSGKHGHKADNAGVSDNG